MLPMILNKMLKGLHLHMGRVGTKPVLSLGFPTKQAENQSP